MSRAGNPPVDTIGVVDIYAPTSNPYFRLKWPEPDGTPGDTSGGRTLEGAQLKAAEIDARVGSAAGPLAVTTLEVMVKQFLLEARSPYKTKKHWPNSYKTQIEDQMHRCVRLHEHYRAMDVDRALCDSMRAQGGTSNMVRQNTTALRAFLLWGFQKKYFTAAQAELLPRGGSHPAPTILGTEMPARRRQDRHVGQDETYVQDEDAPSAGQVIALRAEFAGARPAWGALAVELGCGSGPRWGEEFQLTAYDVHLGGCCRADQPSTKKIKKKRKEKFRPHIHIDWQIDPGANAGDANGRRCRPKGGKRRTIPIPKKTFTGYPLRVQLAKRVGQALAEQAAGTNPEALLFPAARGGLQWYSSFNDDLLLPAMERAGWPLEYWSEVRDVWSEQTRSYTRVERKRTTAQRPWHTLRHRFARTMIDRYEMKPGELMAVGGWENRATVDNRYYKSGKEHEQSALDRIERG
ncbi:hypothetical protein [Modestobacter marinus]|uniref:hypothetical protein n=1 Tax=Modestobacter marinus TaxID=477641 RepID=UPI001C9646A6|nr:hypothetical protein [Modestobacter marinus]